MIETNGKRVLEQVDADAVFTTCEYLKRYITGFLTEGGYVLVDKTGSYLYTDLRYFEAAEKLFAGTEVEPKLLSRENIPSILLKGYKKVAIPFAETSYPEYKKLEEVGVELVDCMPALKKLMAVKNETELSSIKKACAIAEEAFLKLLPQIKEGMTEAEVAAHLEFNMRMLGAEGPSFDTIVAFGSHGSVPHHVTGTTKLQFGDAILIDFGCKVDGYCSDITRTFLFGDDGKHETFKKAYRAVLEAHEAVKANLRSGMTGHEADKIARDVLEKHGYANLFTHSLGHGVGLKIHEFPSLRTGGEDVLVDGMVFSDEPGVYEAGKYGIRIEDTVTLKDGKVESFMTKTSHDLVIL